jgi:polynucleotide 5'-hydroxyl-kinase GRC3/NOL9
MSSPAPVSAMSAVAARRARQQQAQAATTVKPDVVVEITTEPPSKRPRRSLEGQQITHNGEESKGRRTRSSTKQEASSPPVTRAGRPKKTLKSDQLESPSNGVVEENEDSDQEELEQEQREDDEEMAEDEVASVIGDADGYESPADTPAELQNFPLSKARLNKSNIIYADDDTMCVRIKEKTVWQTPPASAFNITYSTLESGLVGTV